MKLHVLIYLVLALFISCESLNRNNEKTTGDSLTVETKISVTSENETSRPDTIIYQDISEVEFNEFMTRFNSTVQQFRDSICVFKLFDINGDTVILDKKSLRRLPLVSAGDPYLSAYEFEGDTLILDNECSGSEILNFSDSLKVIFDYTFDCVESGSYDKLKYLYLEDNVLVYEDHFSETWIPHHLNETKIRSERREVFMMDLNRPGTGIKKITIEPLNGIDTIKISRVDYVSTISGRVVKKLLPIKCINHGG
jgi:hypothetical protein